MNYEEEPRYRKRAQKQTPTKSKHKHDFANCVYEIPKMRLDETHGLVNDQVELSIGTYCTICGKIGTHFDHAWREKEDRPLWNGWIMGEKWSDEAKKEFDESTRMISFFHIDDLWKQKYVQIGE